MERPLVSTRTKQEYVQAIYHRYRGARRPEKQRILDEFCQVTQQHRKHAIRLLNGPAPGAARPPRTRDVLYERATIDALQKIWAAESYPRSVRLKALLPLWLPWARRRLRLRPAVEQQLLRISPRLKQGFIVVSGARLSGLLHLLTLAALTRNKGARPSRLARLRRYIRLELRPAPNTCGHAIGRFGGPSRDAGSIACPSAGWS